MKDFKNLSVTIVTHVYATGPSFKLEDYLKNRVKSLIFIGHPFSFAKDTRSFIRVYRDGELVLEKKFIRWRGFELFFYLKDILLTLWWCFRYSKGEDYFIGVNNFNAFAGYIVKLFGRTKDVVFYTIDYIPQRFNARIMNSVYHFLDRFVVSKSLKVWNLSSRMVKEREKTGVDPKFRKKQIVVPIGTDISESPIGFNKIDKSKIVFMGHLREGHGIEMLISAMKRVTKRIPNAHLLIVGGGPLESTLKSQVEKLKLGDKVKFSGFVEDFVNVKSLIKDAAIAVAPYADDVKTYTRYTDPGKPKDYMSCGLPVIITKVPQIALTIHKERCGIAINYDESELVEALEKLLRDDRLLLEYRQNAFELAKKYTWEKVFNKAFQNTL